MIFYLLLVLVFSGCRTSLSNKRVEVNLGVKNYSDQLKKVDMQVYLNKLKIVDQIVVRDPHEIIFQLKYPPGNYELKATALNGKVSIKEYFSITKSDTLIGLTVGFVYHEPDQYDNKRRKMRLLSRITKNGKVINDW